MEVPKVTCDDVNALAKMCSISREKDITTLKECSSSLFVLLYQRLFNCSISGIETSPYTVEQKRWNVTRVLNELQDRRGIDVTGIDAEEVVRLNEEHISRLIRLFMDIAERAGLQGGVGVDSRHSATPTNTTGNAIPATATGGTGAGTSFHPSYSVASPRPVLAEVPHDSGEDGTWYAPVGTVEEWRSMYPYHTRNRYAYPPGHGGGVNNVASAAGGAGGVAGVTTTAAGASTAAVNAQVDNEQSRHAPRPMPSLDHYHHYQHDPSQHHLSHAARAMMGDVREITRQEDLAFPAQEYAEDDGGVHQADMDDSSAGSYGNIEDEEIPMEQLVKAWSAEVIPPEEAPYMRNVACFADVQQRLLFLQNKLGKAVHRQQQQRPTYSRSSRSRDRIVTATTSNTIPRGVGKGKKRHINNIGSIRKRDSNERLVPRLYEEKHVGYSHVGGVQFPHSLLPDTVSPAVVCKQPKRMIDYTLRDEKIEMLRSLRFIGDMQKDIRRKLVERHSRETQRIREEIRRSLKQDQQELIERKRQIRDEDERYRRAYATIVTAASNNLHTADALMRERTRQLAEYQTQTLRENRAMSRYLKSESKERMRHDLLHYASVLSGWQAHFVI